MNAERKYIVSDEQIKNVKSACKTIYFESRKIKVTRKEQDKYLFLLLIKTFFGATKKVFGTNQTEFKSDIDVEEVEILENGFFEELKGLMIEWEPEFEQEWINLGNNKRHYKKWWKFWS